jgi:hypothetical protein
MRAADKVQNEYFDNFMLTNMSGFEKGWEAHSKQLKKYILNNAELKDWAQISVKQLDPSDQEFFSPLLKMTENIWINSKTGIKQAEHPGHKYYALNKKSMRKRAEEKFQVEVLDPIEVQRIRYNKQSAYLQQGIIKSIY